MTYSIQDFKQKVQTIYSMQNSNVSHLEKELEKMVAHLERHEGENIEQGLILEFNDLRNHFLDKNYWQRFIESLTYLMTLDNFTNEVAVLTNTLQSLELHVDNNYPFPMAVSLVNPLEKGRKSIKNKSKERPKLLINPTLTYVVSSLSIENFDVDSDDFYYQVYGILLHEAFHIVRGDLLIEVEHYTNNYKRLSRDSEILKNKDVYFQDKNKNTTFDFNDLHTLANIMSDLSINEYLNSVDGRFIPGDSSVNKNSTAHTLEETYNHLNPDDNYGIEEFNDLIDNRLPLSNKFYALFDYFDTFPDNESEDDDDDGQYAISSPSDLDELLDKLSESTGMSKEELLKEIEEQANKQITETREALKELSDGEKEELIEEAHKQRTIAESEAEEQTGGKSFSLDPDRSIREIEIRLRQARALPKFDAKVKGLINDYRRETTPNYMRRHIAYPSRLDLAHLEKRNKNGYGGLITYLDISGSVSDDMIRNIYSILMQTAKQEKVILYVFASALSDDYLEINKQTTIEDVKEFTETAGVGYGTTLEGVFANIVKENDQKHIIISDYFYDEYNEFPKYADDLKDVFIIHCVNSDEDKESSMRNFKEYASQTHKMIKAHPKKQKLLNVNDYLL